jgi:L-seryl-tRNA(Ser) seleniumtransferase
MDARNLPSVERLASDLEEATSGAVARPILVGIARDAIEAARHNVAAGGAVDPSGLGRDLALRLARSRPQRIINATGVLLHTNLGRATVAPNAARAAALQAEGYGNVEFDLETGSRGTRAGYLHTLLASLTGAEAALVVNNNAAALLLALAALAAPGNVVVSRGELIEIGGSFRLPTLMAASGAAVVEVGTTNRTRLADYSEVVSDAGILLKIHPSNYRIEGFVEAVDWRDLAALAGEHDVPFVADVGSGLLDTRTPWLDGPPPAWIEGEPGVRQTIEQGAGIVLFSGDKLLGGPQAGLVVGRRPWVETMRRHPLARALRIDAPTTASLTTTLEHYAAGAGDDIPFWRMASLSYAELEVRHAQVLAAAGIEGVVVESASVPGAGSVPGAAIPSPALQLAADPDAAWRRLAAAPVAIIGRRHEGACLIDLRTVDPDDDPAVIDALRAL